MKQIEETKIYYKIYNKDGKELGCISKEQEKYINNKIWIKVVTCFVINEKGEVLIEKRVNKGLNPGMLDLCSGHLEGNETPTQAMIRELKEELDIDWQEGMNAIKLNDEEINLSFTTGDLERNFLINIFCLKRNKSNIKMQEEEMDDIFWVPLQKCFELIRTGKTRFSYNESNKHIYEEIFKNVEQIAISNKLDKKIESERSK